MTKVETRAVTAAVLLGLLVGGLMAMGGSSEAAGKTATKSEFLTQGVLWSEPKEGNKTFDGSAFKGKMFFQKKQDGKWKQYGQAQTDTYTGHKDAKGGVIYWPDKAYPTTTGSTCRMVGKGPLKHDNFKPSKDTMAVSCKTGSPK